MSPLTHVVHKPLRDDGIKRLPGELVEALHWRTVSSLEDQRRISPIPSGLEPVASVDGRWWADREFIRKYKLQEQRPTPPVDVVKDTPSLPDVAAADTEEPQADEDESPPSDFPRFVGGSVYELSDGSRVRGKQNAIDAEAALEEG